MSKEKLYKIITAKTGKPDYLAIELYLDIKNKLKKNNQSVLQIGYPYFTEKYKQCSRTIARKFALLEKLGLAKRSFTTEVLPSGNRLANILNLSLLEGGNNE